MSSLVQLIEQWLVQAITEISVENPALNREGEMDYETALQDFIARLKAKIRGSEVSAVDVPVVLPVAVPAVAPAAPLTKEEKAAEKAAAKAAKDAKAAEKAAAKAAKDAAKADAPPKSPPKSPEEKAADKEAKAAAKPPKAPKPAPGSHLPKIVGKWSTALKEGAGDRAKSLQGPFLAHVNSLTKAEFDEKGAKEHVTSFLATLAPAAPVPAPAPEQPVDLEVVEFDAGEGLKEWYVGPTKDTLRPVYEGITDAAGALTITRRVGYVGEAAFKGMVIEDE